MSSIGDRKADHLALCAEDDVGFRTRSTLLECVRLVHDALPDMALEDVDTSVTVLNKRLRAPIVIASMTGGTEEAGRINRELAKLAEERGYAFGLGSQRAMHLRPGTSPTYRVRQVAPSALLLGNVGVVQARGMKTSEVRALVDEVGADALCIHLNPAMELVQPGGDRDFSHGLEAIARLVQGLGAPVIVKETGCGISPAVERSRALGEAFWDWGIPTAASVALLATLGFETLFATGGIGTGLDVARALALGATAAGIARPLLRAVRGDDGGIDGTRARALLDRVEDELRTAMLLTRSRDVRALRDSPRVVVGELATWLRSLSR